MSGKCICITPAPSKADDTCRKCGGYTKLFMPRERQPCQQCKELQAELEYDQRNAAMSQEEAGKLLDKVEELEKELEEAQEGCVSATGKPCTAMRERELWRKSHKTLKAKVADVVEKMNKKKREKSRDRSLGMLLTAEWDEATKMLEEV